MQTSSLVPRDKRSIPFNSLFEDLIFAAFFRFESLLQLVSYYNSTFQSLFLEPLMVFIQWQSATFAESTIRSNFSNNFNTVCPRSFNSVESGIPVTSRYSRLEYWLLLKHCLFIFIYLFSKIPLTCLCSKLNYKETRTTCKCHSGVFTFNFEQILHLVPVFL